MKYLLTLISLLVSFLSSYAAYNENDIIPDQSTSIVKPTWDWTWVIDSIFKAIIDYTFWFLALITIAVFIYIGYLFITSSWNEEQFKKAWKMLMYAVIWLAIVWLSWWVVKLVTTIWL